MHDVHCWWCVLSIGHDCAEKKCHGTEPWGLHGCHPRSSGEEESQPELLRLARWDVCSLIVQFLLMVFGWVGVNQIFWRVHVWPPWQYTLILLISILPFSCARFSSCWRKLQPAYPSSFGCISLEPEFAIPPVFFSTCLEENFRA